MGSMHGHDGHPSTSHRLPYCARSNPVSGGRGFRRVGAITACLTTGRLAGVHAERIRKGGGLKSDLPTSPSPAVGGPTDSQLRSCRFLVLAVAGVFLLLKAFMAGTTLGTNDAFTWTTFADAVRHVGPIRVYSFPFAHDLYNHPPLIGYYLWVLNLIESIGPSIRFLVRVAASMADVITAVLVFEMLRLRRSLRKATIAGISVAASPVLLIISGFHANTDPILTMLVVAAGFLLVDRNRPGMAGIALALAIGVKIVPIVVVPAFLVYALSRGRRSFAQFCMAFVVVVIISWGPALALELDSIMRNVIGFGGISVRQWGLPQLVTWVRNDSTWDFSTILGPWKLAVLAVSALLPAWLVWRQPAALLSASGIAIGSLLALSPAFAHQYLVWPVALLFFVSVGRAVLYNILAGALLAVVYTRWNHGFPWDVAWASPMTPFENILGMIVWFELVCTVTLGAEALWIGFRPANLGRLIDPPDSLNADTS